VTIYRDSALSLTAQQLGRLTTHAIPQGTLWLQAKRLPLSSRVHGKKANPLGTSGRHFLHASGTRMAQLRLPVVPFVSCSSAPVAEKLHA
jgi:hypothetical protein